ncbi:unnamed protein product, partial [Polarella glacialis]
FRKLYNEKVRNALPAQRARCFVQVTQEMQGASAADLWRMLEYKTDWLRVSKRLDARGFQRSAKCCYVHYVQLLHPDINRGPFTKAEDMSMLKLATEHGGFHWDKLAA